ncbi:hypothetical protein B0T11DRAFT_71550 [Plectosphaerella cucumerina]|uniref:Secreted protein n=1 Tax=Plectosphaerella cucumerina TaxID=40658 RepID=A0A8K0TPW1_9PEZI|nr:hypothetical protein B0T11DRAFT_71550 [Plectosphaerella cucumerina]
MGWVEKPIALYFCFLLLSPVSDTSQTPVKGGRPHVRSKTCLGFCPRVESRGACCREEKRGGAAAEQSGLGEISLSGRPASVGIDEWRMCNIRIDRHVSWLFVAFSHGRWRLR